MTLIDALVPHLPTALTFFGVLLLSGVTTVIALLADY